MSKKFLITTALEETWHDSEPALFLGEWCRLYSRKKRWSSMDAEVLPYHWDNPKKFYADYQYLSNFYERLLPLLAEQLNLLHKINEDVRYWRILIGPWLAYFVQILFDRWCSIELALARFEISGTVILTGKEERFVPRDMGHVVTMMVNDEWNHYILGIVLEKFTHVPCIKKPRIHESNSSQPVIRKKISIRQRLRTAYRTVAGHLANENDAFLLSTYLPPFDEWKLQMRLCQIPQFWRSPEPVRVPLNWEKRNWKIDISGQTDFESFVLSLIPRQIPIAYLEGYRELIQQIQTLPWPKRPKVIFTSNVLWHDTISMAYTAEKVARGAPLVYGQHGGVYGVAKFTWAEDHEVAISDRYLTWGWTSKSEPKIRPLGIVKNIRHMRSESNLKCRLLFVTLDAPRFTYRLSSESLVLSEKFIEDSFKFVEKVSASIQSNLIIRLTRHEYGWNLVSRWQDRFPKIQVDVGTSRMDDLLVRARLAVYTYNSTGFLEAFARNIPAVIFWDPVVSPLRESALPSFDALRRVGIFHESPESAARHVQEIWDDVDNWWNSAAVRETLARFKENYCHQPENLLDCVESALREVIAVSDK